MREITAQSRADLGKVRPRKAQRKREGLFKRVLRFRHWGAVRRYATRAVLWPGFAALMIGVVVNATSFQKGRHPAPLINVPELAPMASTPAPVRTAAVDDAPVASTPVQPRLEAAPTAAAAPADGVDPSARATPRDAEAGHTRPATAKVRPGQPHAPAKVVEATGRAKPADRERLAAMMGAAGKARVPAAN